jgi:3alpha(or 20beta)-hydroxysteroid dehydrogenase
MRLQGKVVLVTGAASGIGHAVTELFTREGATVVASDIKSPEQAYADGVEAVSLDVTSEQNWASTVEAIVKKHGRLDVLINNAGYELAGALEELSLEEARAQFETNFFGVVRMVNAVLPLMRQQQRGHI